MAEITDAETSYIQGTLMDMCTEKCIWHSTHLETVRFDEGG